ncbi:MAG TPA: hypothetical protein VK929_07935 [Longimicrobiales bacterium]|nr:hypothetical protein [Longimicrobiales bacterium]
MFIPRPILAMALLAIALLAGWSAAMAANRNPLPFPDRGYQVFTATGPEAMDALAELLRAHGNPPRFRADSDRIRRSIFWDGTIVNEVDDAVRQQLGLPAAAIGLVVRDPVASAVDAARLLRERGFTATVIEGAEPGLPITFVSTDALAGSIIVFRKHSLRMGQRPRPWTAASTTTASTTTP